jgi:hypothetical protein
MPKDFWNKKHIIILPVVKGVKEGFLGRFDLFLQLFCSGAPLSSKTIQEIKTVSGIGTKI